MGNSSIPKIIHYCWFGKGKKTDLAIKCIESWKKILNDYEFIEWNEENYNINSNIYVKQAYEMKKYAFVSDYVRVYGLYKYGGIYMDTDVEVLKDFDHLLDNKTFFGFENIERISTAIIGCCKNNEIIKEWLDSYKDRKFIVNNKMDMTTNVSVITRILTNYGLSRNGEYQELNDGYINIYPQSYFSPYSIGDSKAELKDNTVTIHWFEGSWVVGKDKYRMMLIKIVKKIIGSKKYEKYRILIKRKIGGSI